MRFCIAKYEFYVFENRREVRLDGFVIDNRHRRKIFVSTKENFGLLRLVKFLRSKYDCCKREVRILRERSHYSTKIESLLETCVQS